MKALGGFYGVPHGLANAMLLPVVLEKFGSSVYKKLAQLADLVSLTDPSLSNEEKAKAFISEIKAMNERLGIPSKLKDTIKEEDIPLIVKRADQEANPLYPVPKLLDKEEFVEILREIME